MFVTNKLSKSVQLALVFGVASPLFMSNAVAAQEQPAADDKVEKIQVTGSRIRSANAMSTSPISTIGEIEIKQQQQPEVERIVRALPSAVPGDGSNVNNGSGGAATINLRGLGRNRNLVLLNGRRLVPFNTSGHVDTSTIPTALIERIDLVTGGASAVYGSDAISGAMNIILKNDFEGVEIEGAHSRTAEADAFTKNMSLTLGGNFDDDKGNAVISVGWLDRDPLYFAQRKLGNYGITTSNGANLNNYLNGIVAARPSDPTCGSTAPDIVAAGGSGTTVPARLLQNGGWAGQFRDDGSLGGLCSSFNFNPYNVYQTPSTRYNVTGISRYNVNDETTVFANVNYASTSVETIIAPSGIFGTAVWLPLTNPFLTTSARNSLITRSEGMKADLAAGGLWRDLNNNGKVDLDDDLNVSVFRRTPELGPRTTGYNADQFQISTGVEGFLTDTWAYSLSGQHGITKRTNISNGYTNTQKVIDALQVDKNGCRTAGCVPLNVFGGYGTITKEMSDYISGSAFDRTNYQQRVVTGIIDGPLDSVVSPWAESPLAMSFGYEWRQEIAKYQADECYKVGCLGGGGGASKPIDGTMNVNELFTEGKLALIEDGWMTDVLELEMGYRHANYNTIGDNGAWKLGLSWRINDELVFRFMNNSATRAPNAGELFAPVVRGLNNADIDPCSVANAANITADMRARCISTGMTASQVGVVSDIIVGQVNTFTGSDPKNLPEAEDASTTTIGVVWTPEFESVKRVNLSVDFYDIYIDGYIGENTPQEVLNACYTGGVQAQCALIKRVNGALIDEAAGIDNYTTNLDYMWTRGVEVQFGFGFDLDKWGSLDFAGQLNRYLDAERRSSLITPVIDCNGYYGTNCDPQHETKMNQRTTWSYEDLSVSLMWRYLSDIDREPGQAAGTFAPFRHIGSFSYFDLFAGYQVNEGVKVSFGVDNLLDRDVPIVGGEAAQTSVNGGNTFPSHYDPLGRTYKFTVNVKF